MGVAGLEGGRVEAEMEGGRGVVVRVGVRVEAEMEEVVMVVAATEAAAMAAGENICRGSRGSRFQCGMH